MKHFEWTEELLGEIFGRLEFWEKPLESYPYAALNGNGEIYLFDRKPKLRVVSTKRNNSGHALHSACMRVKHSSSGEWWCWEAPSTKFFYVTRVEEFNWCHCCTMMRLI